MQRAARWDGVLLRQWNAGPITRDVIREIADYISEHLVMDTPFNIIKYGLTKGENLAHSRTLVQEFSAASATWWIEEIFSGRGTLNQIRKRIASDPPR